MKSWPSLSVKNSLVTLLLSGLIMIVCCYSYSKMAQSEDPVLDIPIIEVGIIYPGASTTNIESQVVDLLETSLRELEDVVEISSNILDEASFTEIEFDYGVDMEDKKTKILAVLSNIQSQFPEGIYDIEVIKYSTTETRVLQLALISESASYRELEEYAEEIKKSIEKVRLVSKVEILASPEEIVKVALDPSRLAYHKVSLGEIEYALKSYNANIPAGTVNVGSQIFKINTSGSYSEISELKNTVVKKNGKQLILLSDVADVDIEYDDLNWKARYNGQKALYITALMKKGGDVITLREDVGRALSQIESRQNIDRKFVFDQAEGIHERIDGFIGNLLQGIALVGVICLLLLGWKPSLLVMLAVPTSILAGLAVTRYFGYGIDQISIAGLVIALGLLVDDAIGVVENVTRLVKKGTPIQKAAIKGSQQIVEPSFSGTLTTILSFIPILLVPGITGAFIRALPIAVIGTLIASFIISITLLPVLFSKLGKSRFVNNAQPSREPYLSRKLSSFVEGTYAKMLNWTLTHKWASIAYMLLFLILAFSLFSKIGVSFFPKAERPQFRIIAELAQGSNIHQTEDVVKRIEDIILNTEEVDYIAANVGHGSPHIYYNMYSQGYSPRLADIIVGLKTYAPIPFEQYLNDLRDSLATIQGANISVKEFIQGPNSDAPIYIELKGEDLSELKNYALKVESILQNTNGVINISNPIGYSTIELKYDINKAKAISRGVAIDEFDKSIRTMLSGKPVGDLVNANGEKYPIVIRHKNGNNVDLEDLKNISLSSATGEIVKVEDIADLKFSEGQPSIFHLDNERMSFLEADLTSSANLDDVVAQLRQNLDGDIDWKEGYGYQFRGDLESRDESFGNMGFAGLLAFLLIFCVLVLQFKSFSQPMIIFSALPFAIAGSLIMLYLTKVPLSFTGFVGFTSLIGIAINNTIVMVEFANRQISKGKSSADAIIRAAKIRFTPIVLTTLTTILGILPLTLYGGNLWKPMGWVIIGGLLSSTVLVLLVVPVIYQLVTRSSAGQVGK